MSLAAATAAILTAAALLAAPAPPTPQAAPLQTAPFPAPLRLAPAPAAGGQCRPDPASAETPEALARRFHDLGFQQDAAAMAALLAPGAVIHNAHDDVRMSDAEFLSLLGVGRAGRTDIVQTLTSGSTAVLRKTTAYGGEILLVVQTDGGCVTGVTSFYD